MASKSKLNSAQIENLSKLLKTRFEKYATRHKGITWDIVWKKVQCNQSALWSLFQMEESGGEPDVVGLDKHSGEYLFFDCAAESPKGRRSLCYDDAALHSRKEHKPEGSAMGIAEEMGIELLDEEQYRYLQQLGEFDLKTSSWLRTSQDVRKLGGAIFGDRRFGRVFIYHNGAESYYAARGFRGVLRV